MWFILFAIYIIKKKPEEFRKSYFHTTNRKHLQNILIHDKDKNLTQAKSYIYKKPNLVFDIIFVKEVL